MILDILVRAGGGQNFGGGGGTGGTGGGGGGGGFFFIPIGGFGGGGIGFLVLMIVIAVIVQGVRSTGGRRGGGGAAGLPPAGMGGVPYGPPPVLPPTPNPSGYDDSHPVGVPERFRGDTLPGTDAAALGGSSVGEGMAAIRAHDPAFDDSAFTARVERTFFIVQEAWTELKPELSRQVMADGIWQQHQAQIEQYRAQGRRNVLENLAIASCTVVAAHTDQTYDTITTRIHAACADYDVDERGRVVRGNRSVNEWTEDWVFQRSSSATTKEANLATQRCPNCGAPLDVDLAGVCSYCHAPVMSGKFDWVLTRIDQVGY